MDRSSEEQLTTCGKRVRSVGIQKIYCTSGILASVLQWESRASVGNKAQNGQGAFGLQREPTLLGRADNAESNGAFTVPASQRERYPPEANVTKEASGQTELDGQWWTCW